MGPYLLILIMMASLWVNLPGLVVLSYLKNKEGTNENGADAWGRDEIVGFSTVDLWQLGFG